MVFNLFSAPCFGAIGAMKKELGTTKRLIRAIAFQTGLAWILASLIGGVGTIIANLF
jgi:ferrous iron transport protein B